MKKIKHFLCAALCALFLAGTLTAASGEVVYENPSAAYKSSVFYRSLMAVELSGDMRRDIVAVALSQLHYSEGNSEADFNGLNTNGSKNFVEYNKSFGKLDQNGDGNLTYGYPWCASFVSFCLRRADIPKSVASSHVNCTTWLNQMKSDKDTYTYHAKGTYTPIMGDIIFFKNSTTSTRLSDHVGIVLGASEKFIYTIEGNTSDGVFVRVYEHNNSKIIGYVVPNYITEITESTPSDNFVVSSRDSLNMRKGPSTENEIVTELENGTPVEVIDHSGNWANITANGLTGWVSLTYLAPAEFMTVNVEVDDGSGKTYTLRAGVGYSFYLPIPETSDESKEFIGYMTDGKECGTVLEDKVVFTLTENTKLTATFSDKTETTEEPEKETTNKEHETTDTPKQESSTPFTDTSRIPETDGGCNASISGGIGTTLLLLIAFLFTKKRRT